MHLLNKNSLTLEKVGTSLRGFTVFGIYPHNHKHARDFKNKDFHSFLFGKVYLPVSKFSSRLITSRLIIGR